jgi:hypothetical protein
MNITEKIFKDDAVKNFYSCAMHPHSLHDTINMITMPHVLFGIEHTDTTWGDI